MTSALRGGEAERTDHPDDGSQDHALVQCFTRKHAGDESEQGTDGRRRPGEGVLHTLSLEELLRELSFQGVHGQDHNRHPGVDPWVGEIELHLGSLQFSGVVQ